MNRDTEAEAKEEAKAELIERIRDEPDLCYFAFEEYLKNITDAERDAFVDMLYGVTNGHTCTGFQILMAKAVDFMAEKILKIRQLPYMSVLKMQQENVRTWGRLI